MAFAAQDAWCRSNARSIAGNNSSDDTGFVRRWCAGGDRKYECVEEDQ
jgi:hypothetical protein